MSLMSPERIPVLDLQKQYEKVGKELEQAVINVLRSGSYILGKNLTRLEAEVAQLCGVPQAVGVANGTDALVLALWALDVGPGDEVITPPFTFAATVEAIAIRGATPVFVDVDRKTFNLDTKLLERAITPKTKVIMPVHLYGQPADMDPIVEIARRFGLKVVEDNAQAIGATYKGRPTGSLGDIATISFYPTKNLGAAGDAGMVVTRHAEIADRVRVLRAHGSRKRYFHDELGVNSRLDEVQAAVLVSKIPHLNQWNSERRAVAALYDRHLRHVKAIETPGTTAHVDHVWHQYTIRVKGGSSLLRDRVKEELSEVGIDSMCYYPLPLHLQPAFQYLGYKDGDFPVSETAAKEVLSLPMYPELTEAQVVRVAQALAEITGQAETFALPVIEPAQVTSGGQI